MEVPRPRPAGAVLLPRPRNGEAVLLPRPLKLVTVPPRRPARLLEREEVTTPWLFEGDGVPVNVIAGERETPKRPPDTFAEGTGFANNELETEGVVLPNNEPELEPELEPEVLPNNDPVVMDPKEFTG